MIARAFEYTQAASVAEALAALQQDRDAKLLAGGHSLLPLMKLRLATAGRLVDIGRIADLRGVRRDGDRIVVGALTTHAVLAQNPLLREMLPVLSAAAQEIGDLQVRNRGTIGGSIAHGDAAADLPAAVLALDATLHVATSAGEESLPAEGFFLGPMMTALPEGGLLTAVSFPLPPQGTRQAYRKVAHPASGYAVVGVAAVLAMGEDGTVQYARIALTGAGAVPFRAHGVEAALLDRTLSAELAAEAAGRVGDGVEFAGDLYASPSYRRRLAEVHVRRTLMGLL